jgi:hypothetical protein
MHGETVKFQEMFEKYSNIKLFENPSIGNPVVPCGGTDGLSDMTKPSGEQQLSKSAHCLHHGST